MGIKPILTRCALPCRSISQRSFVTAVRGRCPTITVDRRENSRFLSSGVKSKSEVRETGSRSNHSLVPLSKDLGRPLMKAQSRCMGSNATIKLKEPIVHPLFEETTGTWQYVVSDPATAEAGIIDPVLDYDPSTNTVSTKTADSLLRLVQEKSYHVRFILETHAHADHLTAASYLRARLREIQGDAPRVGIGGRIRQVQKLFSSRYSIDSHECDDVFDILFGDDGKFSIGELQGMVIHLPGHTPDHMGYRIGDNVFCGDTLFHADIGTARCDFPGGSAVQLFKSGHKLLSLPENVKVWTGHDYPPADRKEGPVPFLTVKEHRLRNKHLCDNISEQEFVKMREERDKSLSEPRLLHQSLQVNIRAGRLPNPTKNNPGLLHLPVKTPNLDPTCW